MPKRNVITYMLFLILSSLLLFACSSQTSTGDYSVIKPGTRDQFGANEDGLLYVVDGLIWFHDFETEQQVIACSLPDCDHEPFHHTTNPDPICLATHPIEGLIETVGMYNDDIYMFVRGAFDESTIYQIDLEGSSRRALTSFDWNINDFQNDFEFKDGMAYFPTWRHVMEVREGGGYESSGGEEAIISVDLETGEINQYGEVKNSRNPGISDFKKIEDKIYFTYNYLDYEGEFDYFDESLNRNDYLQYNLHELDINTHEERIVLDLMEFDGSLYHFDEDYLYILSEDKAEFITLNWDLTESDVLFTGEDIGITASWDDGFIYTQHRLFDGTYYFYDVETGETFDFSRPDDELSGYFEFDGWVYFNANLTEGQTDYVMMNRDDFLAGETDYIYLRERANNSEDNETVENDDTPEDVVEVPERDPDEKTLVWVVSESILPEANVDEEVYIRFNELLQEKGADYNVEFVGFDIFQVEEYQDVLLGLYENNEQVDLLFTGSAGQATIEIDHKTGEETYESIQINPNQDLVNNGMLEPFDDYLNSDEGQKLYHQLDEKLWERLKVNGSIYGVNNTTYTHSKNVLLFNKEIAETMGLQLPEEIEQLDQLSELIKEVSEQNEDVIPFAYLGSDIKGLFGYSYMDSGIAVDYDENGVPHAFNPFENTEVTGLIETLNAFFMKGYWTDSQRTTNQINSGNFFSLLSVLGYDSYRDGVLDLEDAPIELIDYEWSQEYIAPVKGSSTGIASWSNYKEEAFDLLTRVYTDPDFSNLLYYGIEGEHYELEDGISIPLTHEKRVPSFMSPANHFIIHPEEGEPVNKEELLKEWVASGELSPLVGFELDESDIQEELGEITAIYDEYRELWTVQNTDVGNQIEAVNEALHDAGIDDVLEEINAQLQSWWAEKQ